MKTSNVIPMHRPQQPRQEKAPPRRTLRVNGYRLAIVITVIYFVVSFINQQLVMMDLQSHLNRIEVDVEAITLQRAELQHRLDYFQSEEYIQDEARSRFGLGLPGEIQYVTIEGESDDTPANR